jgi:hypothetical protein
MQSGSCSSNSSTIAAGSSNGVTNTRCCRYSCSRSDDGWWYHPKHVVHFPDKINCVKLHLVGCILEYSYDARTHKRYSLHLIKSLETMFFWKLHNISVTLNIRLFELSNGILQDGRYVVRIEQTKNLNKIVFWEFYRRSILVDVDTMWRDNVNLLTPEFYI